ncbi:NAD-dependent succinate-semialdehyde dehydrogenase [Parapedobacter sp. SGR-10]|uniref:NAD-dependent succinate-semialdehyde dehydrogenase n=1 Tax=Parapedobacter sp. SGR-10 TaxID=2710879 RepID=UPI0013F066F0|nr:NAD-dependent succinate-semialdehyde dehydrogenase [Parapedobacter sp. SGR-10]NGF56868.1 NAD-dependent succinate-semialdehyde dehydrogenase [Parapedobacter sp. SGR-10]
MRKLKVDKAYINGQWIAGADTFDVVDPATGSVVEKVANLRIAEVHSAIEAAHTAWSSFKASDVMQRAALLETWYRLILEHKQELAEIITLESGKPLTESLGEVDYGASFVLWFAEESKRSYGETIPGPRASNKILTIKQGIGVVAAITPWNFPLAMVTRKVAPAIAAGCTVVLRPASQTPLTALALAVLAERAGWPVGVLNVVTGKDSSGMGHELSTNPLIRKLSFTGSTSVGKILMKQAADNVKKISLELGGNAPFIVFEDADIEAAVEGAIYAKFRNSGQTCVAVNRFLVQDSIFDQFSQQLTDAVNRLKVGHGMDGDVQIGPLINQNGLDKVQEHVTDAVGKGARILTGGKVIEGLFYAPTVLADVSADTLIAKEETFGPVVSLFRFKTEEEAIQMANNTEFGLASYFYSNDVHRCWRVAEALEAGIVGVNEGRISFAGAPFGGIKESGVGREGSRYGLDEYMELKYINFGRGK